MTTAENWEIYLSDPAGTRIALLDQALSWTVGKAASAPGAFTLALPGSFDTSYLMLDGLIEFYRRPMTGGEMRLFNVYFIRHFEYGRDEAGDYTIISGYDGLDLLNRRIVAYASGASQADKTDQADDMIKAIARENLGSSATDTDRSLEAYVTIESDLALGQSISKAFSRRNVLEVCQEIAEASRQAGTEVYFWMYPTPTNSGMTWTFRTHINQPGVDLSSDFIFGPNYGNVESPVYIEDYTEEMNYIYAGGQGEGSLRVIETASDTDRMIDSIYNRREGFADARQAASTDDVYDEARSKLAESRPRKRFSCMLLDTPGSQFGVDWDWGDRVTVDYRTVNTACVIRAVEISRGAGGGDIVTASVEADW